MLIKQHKTNLISAAVFSALLVGCGAGEEATSTNTNTNNSPTNITLASTTLTINEGTALQKPSNDLTVRLSKTMTSEVVINYETVDGTAVAGQRYQATSGTLTLAPGERDKSVNITILGNDDYQEDGRFEVMFSLVKGDNVKLLNDKATVIINDDDPEPKVSLEVSRVDVREGVGVVDIFATLDRKSFKNTEATLAISGLASQSNDFSIDSTKITFDANTTRSHTFITILEDDIIEGSETINIELSSVLNGNVGTTKQMQVLILGDLKLNDTGVVSYYNENAYNALIPDASHPHQDADYGLDNDPQYMNKNGFAGASYNKIDDSGNYLPQNAIDHRCVVDQHTGLTWQIKGAPFYYVFQEDPTGDDLTAELEYTRHHYNNSNGKYMWYDANDSENGGSRGGVNKSQLKAPVLAANGACIFPPNEHPLYIADVTQRGCTSDKYVQLTNKDALCGNVDWRLPTINELQTLMIYEDDHRGFDPNFFPDTDKEDASNTGGDFIYLSSTPSVENEASVWCMDVAERRVKLCNKTQLNHVRLVRGNKF